MICECAYENGHGLVRICKIHGEHTQQMYAGLQRKIIELEAEDVASGLLVSKLSDLLERTVNVIKGDPPTLTLWSYDDIPELATEMKADNEQLKVKIIELQKELESVYAQDGVKYQTPFLRSYKE